ncbi:hypothetical protein GH714_021497 [Hevea brasiliensis]|uniref:non-specific serine/threonine protein kinase n=1 Tax=Hevea brasiliensis TaxID=3981 RepID=A0A6A6LIH5_HEVBR|nr:hypothetical protein GH714_021497 [Hevea brasiliensis]
MGCFLSKTSTDARDDRSYLHAPLPNQSIDPIESSSSSDKKNRSHAPAHLPHYSPFLDPIESSLSSDEDDQIHAPAQSLVIDPIESSSSSDEEENQNPEYGDIQIVSEKSDVYSFGVVLLELITGRKPLDNRGDTIINWGKDRIGQALENNEYTDLVDSRLQEYNVEEMIRMICCAAASVYKPSRSRPIMKQIIRVLEGTIPHVKIMNWKDIETLQARPTTNLESVLSVERIQITTLRISDIGLAKEFSNSVSHISTIRRGTIG